MKRRLVVRPEARIDIKDATRWYEREKPGLGRQLVAELDRLFERILQNPGQFRRSIRKSIALCFASSPTRFIFD